VRNWLIASRGGDDLHRKNSRPAGGLEPRRGRPGLRLGAGQREAGAAAAGEHWPHRPCRRHRVEEPPDIGSECAGWGLERVVHRGECGRQITGHECGGQALGRAALSDIGRAAGIDSRGRKPRRRAGDHGMQRRHSADGHQPLAAAGCDRRTTLQEKWHVAAELRRQGGQPAPRPVDAPSLGCAHERGCGIARTAAQPRPGRNLLHEIDLEAPGLPSLGGEQPHGPDHEV